MKIGIELNNIIRDINYQLVKYYKKDIDKSFDDENFNYNVTDVLSKLKFKNKKAKKEYVYVDYPYEIFGCANTMDKNLSVSINNWLISLYERENQNIEVCAFSDKEENLTIQSTYFFLSKIGSRIREMIFPIKVEEMWDKCDVIITNNTKVINSKPNGKVVILINNDSNYKMKKKCDLNYNSLLDLINDENFIEKVNELLNNKSKNRTKHHTVKFVTLKLFRRESYSSFDFIK